MLKLKMMLCVMMLPLVVVSCTSKQSVSQCISTTASGVDNAASPDWADTAERDRCPQRRVTGKNSGRASILMSSIKDDFISIDAVSMCEQYTRFQRSINA